MAVHVPVSTNWPLSHINDLGSYPDAIWNWAPQRRARSGRKKSNKRTSNTMRTKQGILQVKGANSSVEESPHAEDTEYEEALQDVWAMEDGDYALDEHIWERLWGSATAASHCFTFSPSKISDSLCCVGCVVFFLVGFFCCFLFLGWDLLVLTAVG